MLTPRERFITAGASAASELSAVAANGGGERELHRREVCRGLGFYVLKHTDGNILPIRPTSV